MVARFAPEPTIHALLILSIAFGAFCATFLGGLAALRFQDRLHLILAFSAGTVIALAFFDLLPEALHLGGTQYSPQAILVATAIGFFVYVVVDQLFLMRGHDAPREERGWAGAGSLSAHSLMDGLALGIGFQASQSIGVAVAVAILAHDCSDGMNTVSLVLKNGGSQRAALRWLWADAVAPILGAAISLFIQPSTGELAFALAAFAGFFLYIGASDLLPESFHTHAKTWTVAATLAGAATLYLVVRVAG
jgi:ZIP family zinc transporter